MYDFIPPIPPSIAITAVTMMAMEGFLIVSTGITFLRSGSEVDASVASASAEVFSPLGIRVRENCLNCAVRSFTTFNRLPFARPSFRIRRSIDLLQAENRKKRVLDLLPRL